MRKNDLFIKLQIISKYIIDNFNLIPYHMVTVYAIFKYKIN